MITPCHKQHKTSNLEDMLAAWACRVGKEKTVSCIKLQYSIIQAANWKMSWNYSGGNAWFMPTVKKHLLMWVCSISAHAIHLSNYEMKYELLIGGVHLMHNFVVNCAKWQTGSATHCVSIYGNILSPFLECCLVIISIFNLLLLKMVMLLKMILTYNSVPHWSWGNPNPLRFLDSCTYTVTSSVT